VFAMRGHGPGAGVGTGHNMLQSYVAHTISNCIADAFCGLKTCWGVDGGDSVVCLSCFFHAATPMSMHVLQSVLRSAFIRGGKPALVTTFSCRTLSVETAH
jgi:hypothetical protein